MPRRRFIFETPDHFTAGAIGEPGHRAFFLQAGRGRNLVTVAIEKVQVAVLAERLAALLEEVERRGGDVPTGTDPVASGRLQEPFTEAFRVGSMTLAWDSDQPSVVIEAREVTEDDGEDIFEPDQAADGDDEGVEDDDAEDGPDVLQVRISAPGVRAFIAQAAQIVAAGRPPCPLCGLPLNPEGHICPRRNGYMH